jgi:hypothetical protein
VSVDELTEGQRKAAYEHGLACMARRRELAKLTKRELLDRAIAGGLVYPVKMGDWFKDDLVVKVWEQEERAAGRNPYPDFSKLDA